MDVLIYLYLLSVGFVVGLSGALIPGPLLAYTVSESMKKGRFTGFVVILGHALVEVFVVLLLLAGLSEYMRSRFFISAVSLLGGLMLIYMAYMLYRESGRDFSLNPADGKLNYSYNSLVFGGIFFTLFNPSFPIWWATAGNRLLLEGLKSSGSYIGVFPLVFGHWIADFGWYSLVSYFIDKKKQAILAGQWYRRIRLSLALLLLLLGAFFLSTVL